MGVCPTLGEAEAEQRALKSSLAELLLKAQLICTHLHELSDLCVCALHFHSFVAHKRCSFEKYPGYSALY